MNTKRASGKSFQKYFRNIQIDKIIHSAFDNIQPLDNNFQFNFSLIQKKIIQRLIANVINPFLLKNLGKHSSNKKIISAHSKNFLRHKKINSHKSFIMRIIHLNNQKVT